MREWSKADIEVLEIENTQFGPYNKEVPDSEKTAVTDADGNILGYKQQWGERS